MGWLASWDLFIDVVLEQPILHLVCRQEVYLKNSVDWELVRGDVKGLNWNEIIRFPCSVSMLIEAVLRAIMSRRSLCEIYCFSRCFCFFSNTYVLYTIRKDF